MAAPQHWTPLPAMFPEAPRVRHLRDRFGAIGPYTLVVLIAEATKQRYLGREPGTAKVSWPDLNETTGYLALQALTADALPTPGSVVDELERIGLLDRVERDAFGFGYRLTEWAEWDNAPRDPTAAARKRRQRERERDGTGLCVTERDSHAPRHHPDKTRLASSSADAAEWDRVYHPSDPDWPGPWWRAFWEAALSDDGFERAAGGVSDITVTEEVA